MRGAGLCLVIGAGTALAQESFYGPPDRTEITRFMSRSSMDMTDLNNDCHVSDVDVALSMLGRMTELYGPDFAGVGDQDDDGASTYEDVVVAVGKLVRGAFGKTAEDGSPLVGDADVHQTAADVASGETAGDINLDGEVDADDLLTTVDRYGDVVSEWDIRYHARLIVEYVGVIQELGTEAFMASECAPGDHLVGISDTWPSDHPWWWPPNHLWSISDSYDGEPPDGDHSYNDSRTTPVGPHLVVISDQWPANHLWYASDSWLPPRGSHIVFQSYSDDPYHETSVSQSWPPSHVENISSEYPPAPEHETTVSRTWWPNHRYDASNQLEMPPNHGFAFTDTWAHQTDHSQEIWPPNHQSVISAGWGSHNMGQSAHYPPGHHAVISRDWRGPQPSWPPGHTYAVSETWGTPGDEGWPVFPPDHSWWTTVTGIPPWDWIWPWH